jgi:GntR family transcriptional regulator/MocR family aminotransferase
MARFDGVQIPLIAFDRQVGKPIYLQLYEGYRDVIIRRQLKPGQRIPSTRRLAKELNVSRICVLNAFEQLLAEGYVESKAGSGTFVAGVLPEDSLNARERDVAWSGNVLRGPRQRLKTEKIPEPWHSAPWNAHMRAFRISTPALDRFPLSLWCKLVGQSSGKQANSPLSYGNPMGDTSFREAIADYLKTVRGVRCEADQIMVVNGSQQALQIAASVLLDSGSSVWMEEPGYSGAQAAFRLAGARIIRVPLDLEGLNVAAGIKMCPRARAAYVTPAHQYPLGTTMSASRRLQLLEWAARNGAWIIEDDYDSEFRYSGRPVASLQGMDEDSRVIFLGTFSKVMFPALRLGYAVIPRDLVGLFAAAREVMDWSPPSLYQAAMTEFMKEGYFARHVRKMRMLYRERRDVMVSALHSEANGLFELLNSDAGMHVVVLLPKGMSDTQVAQKAAEVWISATPLSLSYLKRPLRGGLILGFGNIDTSEIYSNVLRLVRAVK